MKLFLTSFIIILTSVPIKSNTEPSTTSNEVDNSKFSIIKEMEGQCYEYCFNIVQPILEHTVKIQLKEEQIQEQSNILRNLEKKLSDLQTKIEVYEETIKNKYLQLADQLLIFEKTKNEITAKLEVCENTIKNKDLQLALQITSSEKYKNETTVKAKIYEETIKNKDIHCAQQHQISENNKNEILVKLGICEKMYDKFKNETIEKNNMIASKEELQSQMKEKLIEYKVKSENCLSSSCIGKLNDVYEIKVPGIEAFSVFCDSNLAGSGWTVIQRRKDGSVNFNRSWTDYRQGFGDLRGEFFIGLEKLYLLTLSQPHELYISLMDFENETRYARYSNFLIGSEAEYYKLKAIESYSGNAGDSMQYHRNIPFSTPDEDHDTDNESCAQSFGSGWWFDNCYNCNLNGLYVYEDNNKDVDAIEWRQWKPDRPLKFTQMMIKPKSD